jgi:putative NADH-flavin reductase
VIGDAGDGKAVAEALAGSDCAVSALGSGNGTLVRFARAAIPAMQRSGPRRLVSLVGAGVSDSIDAPSLGRSLMLALMGLAVPYVLADADEHARLVRNSDLDWTLVRPPRLVNGPPTGQVKAAPTMRLGPTASILRTDLAAFMLELAVSGRYLHQAPMVANARA